MFAGSRIWEKCGPLVVAAVAALVFFCLWDYVPLFAHFPEDISSLLEASVTFGALFASLVASATSFVGSIDTPAARKLREEGEINLLLRYCRSAVRASCVLLLWSLCGYFVDAQQLEYLSVWLFLVVWSVLTFWRCFDILVLVLWKDTSENPEE